MGAGPGLAHLHLVVAAAVVVQEEAEAVPTVQAGCVQEALQGSQFDWSTSRTAGATTTVECDVDTASEIIIMYYVDIAVCVTRQGMCH